MERRGGTLNERPTTSSVQVVRIVGLALPGTHCNIAQFARASRDSNPEVGPSAFPIEASLGIHGGPFAGHFVSAASDNKETERRSFPRDEIPSAPSGGFASAIVTPGTSGTVGGRRIWHWNGVRMVTNSAVERTPYRSR